MAKYAFILLTFGLFIGIPHDVYSAPKIGTNDIRYIGTIEGKTFLAQMSPLMTWNEAKRFCSDNSMHLASVTSPEQRSLLVQAHNSDTFYGHFWTGGRDAQTQSQLVWDYDQAPLNTTVVARYWHGTEISTCMTFYPKPTFADYVFDSVPCSTKRGVLCEIIHAK